MSRSLELSRKAQQRAERVIPGGVNSPVRAFRSVGGYPPIIARGVGAYLWDVDANEYIDYVGSWGPLILGHAFKPVVTAITAAVRNGTSYGASTSLEAELAELIIAAMPSMEKIRFVSSGTEATMSAVRLARAYTNRKYVVKFEGCYHGHADHLLAKSGSGLATLGIPGSAGVPEEFTQLTITIPYNSVEAVQKTFKKFKERIAAIIVEPVVGNMGCVPPAPGFLESLREITYKDGALLIFDEVMTGFRVAFGGAQELYKIKPDITCLGKIIGGGLPVGAYGASAKIMDMIAPLGPVYQAGTLSGNPVAMAAGVSTVKYLRDHDAVYEKLEFNANMLVEGIANAAKDAGVNLLYNRVGSMFTWFFRTGDGNVWDWATAEKSDTAAFGKFHRAMLDAGIYLPPSQFEAAFLSTVHSPDDIEKTVEAARKAFQWLN